MTSPDLWYYLLMDIYTVIGVALAPLGAVILFGVIGSGIRLAIARYMPECWLKRQLLAERIKTKYSAANKRIADQADLHPKGWRHFIGPASLRRPK